MSIKVFISYSHKDETYKDEFVDHLGSLIQNNTISEWNDRKITGSEDWEKEIDNKLEDADIIVFLISSAFISSQYCFGIEAKKALEFHNAGSCKVLPIIIRPVDWQDNDFAKLQLAPKNGKAISIWDDKDSAWLSAVTILKGTIKKYFSNNKERIGPRPKALSLVANFELTTITKTWLEDTEVKFTHRKLNFVSLSNIYTSPDMKKNIEKKDLEKNKPVSSDLIFKDKNHYLISGEEQGGKTTLLKKWCTELLAKNYLPIYINAEQIKRSELEPLIKKTLKRMYVGVSTNEFLATTKKAICIDNIDKIYLNSKYLNKFLTEISDTFEWIIITCDNTYSLISGEDTSLSLYENYTLFNFGNVKREEIISKWVSLGQEETIQEKELYTRVDELKREIDTIVKNNIIPSKPIFILMILQVLEAHEKLDLDLTSHGYCYQQLIIQSFDTAKVKPNEYDIYLNLLTELSWWIFKNKTSPNNYQLTEFIKEYKKIYILKDEEKVIKNLLLCNILEKRSIGTSFKYPYIYYFFVGKKIAESYSSGSNTKKDIQEIIENLHREDYANIIIFITHHTKDQWILTDIKEILVNLFREENKATLDTKQLQFMRNFLDGIPELVIEQREVSKSRKSINQKLDDLKDEVDNPEDNLSKDELLLLANLNKTFKGMEIAGQITRNRYASLGKKEIYDLINTSISSGLRLLNFIIINSQQVKNEIVRQISLQLAEHPTNSETELKTQAEDIYLRMTYQMLNGIIRKIASSIGSKEIDVIYEELVEKEKSPAYILIKQSIDLQFNKALDIEKVIDTQKSLKNNPVCLRLLNEIVINHIYMFPVNLEKKQILADKLKIPIQTQRNLERIKASKG